ncbi:VOC family protein [Kribbella solani]|uniref:VOC family protein n=1 Tax=Kribbella solani TaxID=236067 RepID=UPI0029BF5B1F|nr:VOC family protein [Kribbella solani]MDX2967875.1 VOC family protein [Kribbella solani]MDX3005147.1 VOC family protein [Kribbella solani]
MTLPGPGTLAWFEVATDDPDTAQKFYGNLFDWTFVPEADGFDYRNIKAADAERPMGGILGTGGKQPNHAVFYIVVADIEATCAEAVRLGGSVISKELDGVPALAHLRDPAGNHFGIFTQPGD